MINLELKGNSFYPWAYQIIDNNGNDIISTSYNILPTKEQAEYIVKVVNAYPKLVSALKNGLDQADIDELLQELEE